MSDSKLLRRRFLGYFGSIGLGSTLLPGTLWARWQEGEGGPITKQMLAESEKLAGLEFSDEEREPMLEDVNETLSAIETLRTFPIDNSVSPALLFDPVLPSMEFSTTRVPLRKSPVPAVDRPANLEEVAFWPVTQLSELIRSRRVTSVELTELYLLSTGFSKKPMR